MSMETDLRAMILAEPDVAAIVGSRVAWGERSQGGAVPTVVLTRVSQVPIYAMAGDVGMPETRVQADCWASTYAAAWNLGMALVALLSGFRGDFGGTRFHGVFSASVQDLREADTGDADRFFRVSIDFIIHHTEI